MIPYLHWPPGAVAAYSTPQQRNAYTWEKDIYEGRSNPDWNICYNRIFYANIVLEGLAKSVAPEQASVMWKTLKGSALFYRAFAYYQLAQVFCTAYQPTSSASALGLPLKLTADINDLPQRSSLADTYQQILSDLGQALDLLPLTVAYKNRPSRAACLAMFSRVYLSMGNYDQAEKHATESLGINAKLTDFNTLNATLTSSANPFPAAFPVGNEEVQYWETLYAYNFLSSSLIVDSTLYRSYATNDLRKSVYFVDRGKGVINFKGYFGGSSGGFFGLANDELFLTRAECLARKGLTGEALADLNTMLRSRWKTGTFINLTAPDAKSALELVLKERRKSLFRRGIRWTDLKRLNLDPSNQITLVKILGGQTYTLPPNDLRYVFPIPDDEIRGSGIEQNPR
jgi:tetratricopeptide (TPR) repeat protein